MRACFNGCSLTLGDGFANDQKDSYIYDRLVANHFKFDRVNIATSGSSNYKIFMRSAEALITNSCDILFTQWSALNRLWLSPGPNVNYFVTNNSGDFHYKDIHISQRDATLLKNLVLLLNHDYQNIIELVEYCKLLNFIAEQKNIKIIHINGMLPLTDEFTRPLSPNIGSHLSEYTKTLLDFNHLSDNEIRRDFDNLQLKLSEIDPPRWVNLFESFVNNSTDVGPEGHHPGIESHKLLATKIIDYIERNKIL